jgi:hypothetical protein
MTTPTEISVESIEAVLVEKEAALAKEQAMLEGLKDLLRRMGYELVPARTGKPRRGRSLGAPSSSSSAVTPGGRGRGRPRKDYPGTTQSGETATG